MHDISSNQLTIYKKNKKKQKKTANNKKRNTIMLKCTFRKLIGIVEC